MYSVAGDGIGVVHFTRDHFVPCMDAISKAAPIHDQIWSGVQSETRLLHRTHIYLASMIET
jgi:hypothetical protein